jgi:hypothetical protein
MEALACWSVLSQWHMLGHVVAEVLCYSAACVSVAEIRFEKLTLWSCN